MKIIFPYNMLFSAETFYIVNYSLEHLAILTWRDSHHFLYRTLIEWYVYSWSLSVFIIRLWIWLFKNASLLILTCLHWVTVQTGHSCQCTCSILVLLNYLSTLMLLSFKTVLDTCLDTVGLVALSAIFLILLLNTELE